MVNTPITVFNHIAILGMGRSGQAVLAACLADGISVTVYDDKGATRDTDAYFPALRTGRCKSWMRWSLAPALPISPCPASRCPALYRSRRANYQRG